MSKDQYLEMMEQMGQDPDWEKCPPSWEDFPPVIVSGLNVYNSLGTRMYPDIGFIGKDYTNYDFILKHIGVDEHQEDFVFEIVQFMEQRDIENSQRKLKAEYEKIKRGQ
tara:strand:- start:25 stop:351 length:327 start_codon:yes stop_codon:yes gene_type:complete